MGAGVLHFVYAPGYIGLKRQDLFNRFAVLALQLIQRFQPALHFIEARRVAFQLAQVVAQRIRRFVHLHGRLLQTGCGFGQAVVDTHQLIHALQRYFQLGRSAIGRIIKNCKRSRRALLQLCHIL